MPLTLLPNLSGQAAYERQTYRKRQCHQCGYQNKAVKPPAIQNIWKAAVPPMMLIKSCCQTYCSQSTIGHATTHIELCCVGIGNRSFPRCFSPSALPGFRWEVLGSKFVRKQSGMYPESSGKLTSPDPATISLLGHWARSSHAKEDAAAAAEPAGTSTSWKPSAAEASPSNTNPTDGYSLSSAACPPEHLWSRGPTVESTSGYTDSQFENQVATTCANALFSNPARCWALRLRSNPKLHGGCGPILNWSNPGSQPIPPIFRFRFV